MYSISTCQNRNCQRFNVEMGKRKYIYKKYSLYFKEVISEFHAKQDPYSVRQKAKCINKPHIFSFTGLK